MLTWKTEWWRMLRIRCEDAPWDSSSSKALVESASNRSKRKAVSVVISSRPCSPNTCTGHSKGLLIFVAKLLLIGWQWLLYAVITISFLSAESPSAADMIAEDTLYDHLHQAGVKSGLQAEKGVADAALHVKCDRRL